MALCNGIQLALESSKPAVTAKAEKVCINEISAFVCIDGCSPRSMTYCTVRAGQEMDLFDFGMH